MKYIIKIPILLSVLVITGCFTILTHPEVEVVYQHQNEKNNYSEDYDVYVDEDCNACHTDFRVIKHFNPLLSAHNNAWNATPWWFDDKYMVIFDRETGK